MESVVTLLVGLAFGGLIGYKYAKKKFAPKAVGGGSGGRPIDTGTTDLK